MNALAGRGARQCIPTAANPEGRAPLAPIRLPARGTPVPQRNWPRKGKHRGWRESGRMDAAGGTAPCAVQTPPPIHP
jgi:hypothetical protein